MYNIASYLMSVLYAKETKVGLRQTRESEAVTTCTDEHATLSSDTIIAISHHEATMHKVNETNALSSCSIVIVH